jgi:hypothetical protein
MASRESDIIHANILNNKEKEEEKAETWTSPAVQYSSSPKKKNLWSISYICRLLYTLNEVHTGWDEGNIYLYIYMYIDLFFFSPFFLIQLGGERIGEEWSSPFGSHLVARKREKYCQEKTRI